MGWNKWYGAAARGSSWVQVNLGRPARLVAYLSELPVCSVMPNSPVPRRATRIAGGRPCAPRAARTGRQKCLLCAEPRPFERALPHPYSGAAGRTRSSLETISRSGAAVPAAVSVPLLCGTNVAFVIERAELHGVSRRVRVLAFLRNSRACHRRGRMSFLLLLVPLRLHLEPKRPPRQSIPNHAT